ncbi:MAG: MFS transporter [Candidatus Tectimicrobiota bacterium]|nr:MAG: MFS transporter [Candidatus Tectomicrobia bacterium]
MRDAPPRRPAWSPRQGGRGAVVALLGITQCLAWGSSYYLLAVLAKPIAADTGWSLPHVVAGLSLGLLVAGLASPAMGRAVERRGGRPVLAAGSAVFALGLAGLGLAQTLPGYFLAWAVLGLGMALGLYDAAFATLGRLYGTQARGLITNLTLIGGFASTAAWPLSAFLVATWGWRGACFAYAGLHLALGLPLHLFLLPREKQAPLAAPPPAATPAAPAAAKRRQVLLVWLLGVQFTLQVVISSVLSVHLLVLLQRLGLDLTAAVALGTLVGPSQVGGRLLEAAVGRRFHPVSTAIAASLFVTAGVGLLFTAHPSVMAAGCVLYGAGNGIKTIVKGTLPLALFGAAGYATLLGRLALPMLLAQAIAPTLVAVAWAEAQPEGLLGFLTAVALLNVFLAYALRLVALARRDAC